jgi:hypothetical protein
MGRWNHRDRRYRLFFSLVCFDWIGAVDHENVREQVLAAIDQHAEPELALSWVFVIEHNEKPSHNQFLGGTAQFLQERNRYPRVRRERACIVFANTAGRSTRGRVKDYGQSSLIFPPDAPFDVKGCHPTYSGASQRCRGTDGLDRCIDVFFREGGACIYSFSQYVTHTMNVGVAGRSLPLKRANVHAIVPDPADPRSPGTGVPASVKWLNDQLDDLPSPEKHLGGSTIADSMPVAHQTNAAAVRQIDGAQIESRMATVTCPSFNTKPPQSVDFWDIAKAAALDHLRSTRQLHRAAERKKCRGNRRRFALRCDRLRRHRRQERRPASPVRAWANTASEGSRPQPAQPVLSQRARM